MECEWLLGRPDVSILVRALRRHLDINGPHSRGADTVPGPFRRPEIAVNLVLVQIQPNKVSPAVLYNTLCSSLETQRRCRRQILRGKA